MIFTKPPHRKTKTSYFKKYQASIKHHIWKGCTNHRNNAEQLITNGAHILRKSIPNPINQKNARKLPPKDAQQLGRWDNAPHPYSYLFRLTLYFIIYNPYFLYVLTTSLSERPSGLLRAGAAGLTGLHPIRRPQKMGKRRLGDTST